MRTLLFSGIVTVLTIGVISSCTPDKGSDSLGPLPQASFTVTPVSGSANLFAVSSTTKGGFAWYWDPGDGSGSKVGNATDTLYYDSVGNYRVTLMVLAHGGMDTTSQIVSVTQNDPGVNIVQDSAMTSSNGWTLLNLGAPQLTYNFGQQGLNLSNAVGDGSNM